MKVVFVCGSLDPGHDGVGDYVRLLASELIRQDHEVLAVSINDQGVIEKWSGQQEINNRAIQVLRLPAALPWKSRIEVAKEWLSQVKPDFLSLQFVPFAFDNKGLPFLITSRLKEMAPGAKWVIMFHELWLGMDLEASQKMRLWGWIQRQIIRFLIRSLNPSIIHTHAQIYIRQLKSIGRAARHLPLFSNIPLVNELQTRSSANDKIFIVFGTIHPLAPIKLFAQEAAEYALSTNSSIIFKFIGRNGSELKNWVETLSAFSIKTEIIGEIDASSISLELSAASIGLSTTPFSLVEKSGTVAAMREHGLPIVCVSKEWKAIDRIEASGIRNVLNYYSGDIGKYMCLTKHSPSGNQLADVGRKFIDDVLHEKSN